MDALNRNFKEIVKYPSAIIGLIVILLLIVISIYALVSIPYSEAIRLWRGGEGVWREVPRLARPVWTDLFSQVKLSRTINLSTIEGNIEKVRTPIEGSDMTEVDFTFTFDYPYDGFPQELVVYFQNQYTVKQPVVTMTWVSPDGREYRTSQFSPGSSHTYRFNLDDRLLRRLDGVRPEFGLFTVVEEGRPIQPIKGTYQLEVTGFVFEDDADIDAQLIVYGQVYGMAGTDHNRRDLTVALLWGTPLALSFGLFAAFGTSVITMIISATGVWFGGIVDALIQRITEVNMVLPFLPILIMVGTFYSKSIWVMLSLVILLSIFGQSIKNYRAIFLQVKESAFIEAAQSYGAGNGRIILLYLVPRIIPILIPGLVIGIPSFVFLEASLAVIGLGDPVLPTWGKVINDAYNQGALYNQQYYWILLPALLLIVTGFAFSMLGFALDRIFNPKLREV
jgi:peptide/nickel transport system permease protein